MKDQRGFAAALGFAFVAAWIGFSFGGALLCLLGGAVFWIAAGVLEGNVDLGELQARLTNRENDELQDQPARSSPPPRRPRAKPRVQ